MRKAVTKEENFSSLPSEDNFKNTCLLYLQYFKKRRFKIDCILAAIGFIANYYAFYVCEAPMANWSPMEINMVLISFIFYPFMDVVDKVRKIQKISPANTGTV